MRIDKVLSKFISLVIVLFVILSSVPGIVYADNEPTVHAEAAILIDSKNGEGYDNILAVLKEQFNLEW